MSTHLPGSYYNLAWIVRIFPCVVRPKSEFDRGGREKNLVKAKGEITTECWILLISFLFYAMLMDSLVRNAHVLSMDGK